MLSFYDFLLEGTKQLHTIPIKWVKTAINSEFRLSERDASFIIDAIGMRLPKQYSWENLPSTKFNYPKNVKIRFSYYPATHRFSLESFDRIELLPDKISFYVNKPEEIKSKSLGELFEILNEFSKPENYKGLYELLTKQNLDKQELSNLIILRNFLKIIEFKSDEIDKKLGNL